MMGGQTKKEVSRPRTAQSVADKRKMDGRQEVEPKKQKKWKNKKRKKSKRIL